MPHLIMDYLQMTRTVFHAHSEKLLTSTIDIRAFLTCFSTLGEKGPESYLSPEISYV